MVRIRLTRRAREVLRLLVGGSPNKEIAARLGVSEQAVKEHVSRLLKKFQVPNRAGLADAAARLEMGGEGIILERSWIHQLFRSARVMIAVTSGPEHRYVAVNEAFAKAVNREVLGKTMREAFPELQESENFKLADRVYATGEEFIGHEVPATWDRGAGAGLELGYSDGVVQPLRGDGGEVEGVIYFGIDVTEKVRERTGIADKAGTGRPRGQASAPNARRRRTS